MKFQPQKNAKYSPGFVHALDLDRKVRGQKIVGSGYVASTKNIIFEFAADIPQNEKERGDLAALKKFNERFKFYYQ